MDSLILALTKTIKVDVMQGDAYYDFIKANQAAGYKSTPKGYTWHHVEDGTTMMLVPTDLHKTVRHTGGASLIRKGIRP
ncbi:HNH endonuclease [Clostridium sp. 'deep sea']|uniref:HNH endonuclease signature motif containing protein n=1 Tax=Clostridium sp. 'deep sea' TaxID=2779445 RepID=UPI0018969A5C|nr:HNH endonuclease [Clostridium sp. 'deep sea']QOR35884.1 HNH endonuclease [Clostridium sp. 'deep sea']